MDGEVRDYSEIDHYQTAVLEDALEKDIRDLVAFLITQSERRGGPVAIHAYTDRVHFAGTLRSRLKTFVPPRYEKALDHFVERLEEIASPIFISYHPAAPIRVVLNIARHPIVDRPTPGSPTAYAEGNIDNSILRHRVAQARDIQGIDPEMHDVPPGFVFLAEPAFEDPVDRSTQENKPGNVYMFNEHELNEMEEEREAHAARLMKYSGIEPEKGHSGEPDEETAEGAEAETWLERQNRENEAFFKRREQEESARRARERNAEAFAESRRRNEEFFERQAEGENRRREQEEIARLREESEAAAGGAAAIARLEATLGYIRDHAGEISRGRGLSVLAGLGGQIGALRGFVSRGLGGEDLLGRAASDIDRANEQMAELRHLREEAGAEAAAGSAEEGAAEARGESAAGGAEARSEESFAAAEAQGERARAAVEAAQALAEQSAEAAGEQGRIAGEAAAEIAVARGEEGAAEPAGLAEEGVQAEGAAEAEGRIEIEGGEVVMPEGEPVEMEAAETAAELTGEGAQAAEEAIGERAAAGAEARGEEIRAAADAETERARAAAEAAQARAEGSAEAAGERGRIAEEGAEEMAQARGEAIEETEVARPSEEEAQAEGPIGAVAAEAGAEEERQPSEQETAHPLGEQIKEHVVEEVQKEAFAPPETAAGEEREPERPGAAEEAEREPERPETAERREERPEEEAEPAAVGEHEEKPGEGEAPLAAAEASEAGAGAGEERQPSEEETAHPLGEQLKEHVVEEAQKQAFAPIETAPIGGEQQEPERPGMVEESAREPERTETAAVEEAQSEAAQPKMEEPEVVGAEPTDAGTPPTEIDQTKTELEREPQPSEKEDSHASRETIKEHTVEKVAEAAGFAAAPEEEQTPEAAAETPEQPAQPVEKAAEDAVRDHQAAEAARDQVIGRAGKAQPGAPASPKEEQAPAASEMPKQPVQPSEKPSEGLGHEIRHVVGHFMEEVASFARGDAPASPEQKMTPEAARSPPARDLSKAAAPPAAPRRMNAKQVAPKTAQPSRRPSAPTAPKRTDAQQTAAKTPPPRRRQTARAAAAPPRRRSAQNAQTARAAPKTPRAIRMHAIEAEPFASVKKGAINKARPAPKAAPAKAPVKNRPVPSSRSNPPPKTKVTPRGASASPERKRPAALQEQRRAPRSGAGGGKPPARKPAGLNPMGQKRKRYDSLPKPVRPSIPDSKPEP